MKIIIIDNKEIFKNSSIKPFKKKVLTWFTSKLLSIFKKIGFQEKPLKYKIEKILFNIKFNNC